MKDTKKTLAWIVAILKDHNVPFQITGGLAARSYGATRPINDFDMEIPEARMAEVAEAVRPFIVLEPYHFIDDRWDCKLSMTLEHEGQIIEICAAEHVKICDARTGKWVDSPTDLTKTAMRSIFGIIVPVIPPDDLIEYKEMLEGDHQTHDIAAVRSFLESN